MITLEKKGDRRLMRRCIFCGLTEEDFKDNNCWTEEHIIPEALGNKTLKIFDVCKDCNSGLGTYVDKYFVDHILLKIKRQELGLKAKSGEVPNAFTEGKGKDGQRIRVDEKFQPTTVPHIKEDGHNIRIIAPTKKEAKNMIQKKLSRMNKPEKMIRDALSQVDETESQVYQPVIQYDFKIELNRFFMEAVKIAFEYAVLNLGNEYLKDSRAMQIQQYLKSAIDGKMKNECTEFPGVGLIHKEISNFLKVGKALKSNENHHLLIIHPDLDNRLIAEVILFMEPAFSFGVLLSEDACIYCIPGGILSELVEVKTNPNLPPFSGSNI